MPLTSVADDIWTYEGETVSFFGLPYSTRMTVIRINDNELWIHSPEKLTPDLRDDLARLGEVSYLISPNKLHHLYLSEWTRAYPDALNYAAPGLIKKRKDIAFTTELGDEPEPAWGDEIKQLIFKGSPAMQEAVFYHIASRTLILTDLIENFDPKAFNWWQLPLAKLTGILAPMGKTPVDWRSSFFLGRRKAQECYRIMEGWRPENIIISHGICIFGNGTEFLKKSFAWLR